MSSYPKLRKQRLRAQTPAPGGNGSAVASPPSPPELLPMPPCFLPALTAPILLLPLGGVTGAPVAPVTEAPGLETTAPALGARAAKVPAGGARVPMAPAPGDGAAMAPAIGTEVAKGPPLGDRVARASVPGTVPGSRRQAPPWIGSSDAAE